MAQIDFTSNIGGKCVEDQPNEVDLQNFLRSAIIINNNIESANDLNADEGDVFQCGKCKRQFSAFSTFLTHKRGNCLDEDSTKSGQLTQTYSIPLLQYESAEETQPIVIDDSEILPCTLTSDDALCAQTVRIEALTTEDDNQYLENVSTLKTFIPRHFIIGRQDKPLENLIADYENKVDTIVLSVSENEANNIIKNAVNFKMKCSFCGKQFRKKFDMDQHLRSHTGERPFQCIVCGRTFSQKSNLMKHMATHKVWPKKMFTLPNNPVLQVPSSKNSAVENKNPNDEVGIMIMNKTFVCQFCPCVFNSFLELKSHRKAHESQKVYKCIQKDCCATFKDLSSFLEHSQNHINKGQYECRICHSEFSSLANLGNHLATHNKMKKSSSKTATCRKCKSRFTSLESLNRHLSTDSHRYPCSICHRVFTCERFLRRHLAVHTHTAQFLCPVCNKSFKTEKCLKMHKIIHSNVRPFSCQVCPASFNRKDRLSRHNLTHENEKKFKCPFSKKMGCGKEFNRKDKLKDHILTHGTNEKTFCRLGSDYLVKKVDISKTHAPLYKSSKNRCKGLSIPSEKLDHMDFKIIAQEDCVTSCVDQNKMKSADMGEDDDVPTIEIVVVPVPGHENDGTTFGVLFPPESGSPIDLSNALGAVSNQDIPIYTIKPFK